MIVLSLDIATKTGVAIKYDTGEIKSMVWNLGRGKKRKGYSHIPMLRLWKRINRLSQTHQISIVVFEDPFSQGAARWLMDSLQCCLMIWCELAGVSWHRVAPTVWKKQLFALGGMKKEEYHRRAKQLFPKIDLRTDDQAAALLILTYAERVGWVKWN